jgi:hypothetical protein
VTAGLVDPIGLKLTGVQHEACINALAGAFPTYAGLREMVRYRLEIDLARIAPERSSMDEVVVRLIRDRLSKGGFLQLISAARTERPGNEPLALFAASVGL